MRDRSNSRTEVVLIAAFRFAGYVFTTTSVVRHYHPRYRSRPAARSSRATMPSLLNKLLSSTTASGKKPNPYTDPHHPNHPSTSQPAPTSTNAGHAFSISQLQAWRPQTARLTAPREPHNYLAEAREASGKDPVTGQPRPQNGGQTRVEEQQERGERSVYQEASEGRSNTHGTRYDLFVQEMKARKVGWWRAPDGGFYAPERRLGEFYQPEGSVRQGYGP